MARFVKPTLDVRAPDPLSLSPPTCASLFRLGRRFQSMSAESRYRLVQLMTMSAADFLDQWFETDVLKATMSASGIIGTFQGVRSPGTAYVLLHHYMGEIDGAFRSWGFAKGGTGAISNAIAAAAREAGVEIRTKAGVSRILTRNGRATGVVARKRRRDRGHDCVVVCRSAPDLHEVPRRARTPGGLRRRSAALQVPRLVGKSQPRARRPAEFHRPARRESRHLRGAISISPSLDYMERAYDDAKYGRYSRRPYMDVVIPSLTDPSIAPPGQTRHVVLRAVRAVSPEGHRRGTTSAKRSAIPSSTRCPSTRRI